MLLYLHGFRSGPQSSKVASLAARMRELGCADALWCEPLRWGPAAAIAQIEDVIARSPTTPTLIGSSLGGCYAAFLAERHGLRAVLVNPAVAPQRLLAQWLGTQTNLYTGEAFEVLPEQLAELAMLDITPRHPERLWLLAETGDEVLDHTEAVARYAGARIDVSPGGDHRFSRWEQYLDAILQFAGLPATR